MTRPLSQIKGMAVFTKSGTFLGRVLEIEIDEETQEIIRYSVGKKRFWGKFALPLLIHRDQVAAFEKERMIVEDAAVRQETTKPKEDQISYESSAVNL
ncbi:MAG: PRC-barrel domain-containing protein [Candidatus Magasanikbacteria bacterium]|nr:PRC-barrel domain-containing protein [Candidatus Magasanikbacteria bacterium]